MQNFDECVQFSCELEDSNITQNNTELQSTVQNSTYLFCRQREIQRSNSSKTIEEKLAKLNSHTDFRDFLDEHVRWNISFFVIDKSIETCSNLPKSSKSSNPQLYPQCYNEKNMFETTYCGCKYTTKEDKIREFLQQIFTVFLVLGVISLIGNITVIFTELRALIRKRSVAEEKSVYRVLVLNLSISDLLMGFYLTFFPLTFQFNELHEFNMIPELCHFFGVVSVLSSEISVTVLVLICLYRWIGIAHPYKIIRLKRLKIVVAFMWIIWLIVALIPALRVDLIGFIFTDGIQFSDKPMHFIIFDKALALFKHISNGSRNNNVSQVKPVLKKLVQYKSRDLLHTFLNQLGILNDNGFNYLGYYSYHSSCTLRTFITTPFSYQYYSLSILFYNFFAFIFISIACIVICKNVAKTAKIVEQNGQTVNKQKLRENIQIYRRLLLVIVTDFLCWIPISVTAFYFYFEYQYSSELSKFMSCNTKSTFYYMPLVVLILMPINSVINPYLYSWHIWKKVLKKCKNFVCKKLT